LDRRRWTIAALLAVLIFGVREDAALTTVFALFCFGLIGLYRVLRPATATGGLLLGTPEDPPPLAVVSGTLACCGIAVLALYFNFVNTHLGGWEPSSFYRYSFAAGPVAVVAALFVRPAASWPQVLTLGRAGYLLEAFLCMGFLPFRSKLVVLALPGFAVVLLANSMGVWRIGAQYALLWVPWMIIAFGEAALHLSARARQRWFASCALILALITAVGNPLHLGSYLRPSYHDLADARRALASVGDVPLSTHDEWQTQISVSDPSASPVLSLNSQWFVYADDYPDARFQTQLKPELEALVRRGAIRVARRFGAVVVYQRMSRE
jgi:uncharacterized membrane protein